MYRILNSQGLGAAGRQNELIELALTHSFGGVEVDMTDLLGRHDALGKQFACQFLQSAGIDMGTFALPVDFGAEDAVYAAQLAKMETIIDLAKTLNTGRCYAEINPTSSIFAFQENFEKHDERLKVVAEMLKEHGIKLGVALQASKVATSEGSHKFIQKAEEILTLVKAVGHENCGLMLDTWEWVIGGGGMDQLSECDAKMFTEVRLSDVPEGVDFAKVKPSDRELPGENDGSLSLKLVNHLVEKGYDGAISIATDASTFVNGSSDQVVGRVSARLHCLINGEPVHPPVEPEEGEETAETDAPAEAAAAVEGEAAAGTVPAKA